jgi:hypothetical protein
MAKAASARGKAPRRGSAAFTVKRGEAISGEKSPGVFFGALAREKRREDAGAPFSAASIEGAEGGRIPPSIPRPGKKLSQVSAGAEKRWRPATGILALLGKAKGVNKTKIAKG